LWCERWFPLPELVSCGAFVVVEDEEQRREAMLVCELGVVR
jgi:hypothetical protein